MSSDLRVVVAFADYRDVEALEAMRQATGVEVKAVQAEEAAILRAIDRYDGADRAT